jgi:hypothetical protein
MLSDNDSILSCAHSHFTSPLWLAHLQLVGGVNGTGTFMDTIIDLLTGGDGSFSLSNETCARVNKTLELGPLANMTIGLLEFGMGGLDTWTQLELLQVSRAH